MSATSTFESFSDVDTYREALKTQVTAPFPVLGRPEAMESAGPLYDVAASDPNNGRLSQGDDVSRVILVRQSSAAESVLAAFAECVSAELVVSDDLPSAVQKVSGSNTQLCCAGLSTDISERDLLLMHETAGERGIQLGFLVAASIELLTWTLAKQLAAPLRSSPAHRLLNIYAGYDTHSFESTNVLVRDDATRDHVGPLLLDGHVGLLTFVSHGRDDVVHLKDTVLCGNSAAGKVGPEEPEINAPVCAYTGRCFRGEIEPEQFIAADKVRADVVLSNSCMSLRLSGGLFPERYLLPHAFLRGHAFAYIGAPNLVAGSEKVNLAFVHALNAGASLGEAVSLVNEHLRLEGTDLPYFTLVGAPWLHLPQSVTSQASGAVSDSASSPRQTDPILLFDASGLSERAVPTSARALLQASQSTAAEYDQKAVIFTDKRGRERAGQLFGDTAREMPADDTFDALLRGAGDAVERLTDVSMLGFRYSRQNNLLANLREQLVSASRALRESLETGETRRSQKRASTMLRAVHKAERELADALWERGTTSWFKFEDTWGEHLRQRVTTHDAGSCPYCGRTMWTVEADHPLLARVRREVDLCGRCTLVFDRDPRGPVTNIELKTPDVWRRGTKVLATMVISCGELGPHRTALVGVHTDNCTHNRVGFQGVSEVELVSDSAVEVSVEADVFDDAHMHQEFLRGFVVANGTINYVSRPIWVRPAR